MKTFLILSLLFLLVFFPLKIVSAQEETPTPTPTLIIPPTPIEIIDAVNNLRISHGLSPLFAHPALMQIAQTEASGIAQGYDGHWRPNNMSLGQWMLSMGYPLSGDLYMDGYRSENWVEADTKEDAISFWLSDDEHTNTMLSTNRSDIGAGVAVSEDGSIYVVIETALRTPDGQMQYDAHIVLTGIPLTQAAYSADATQAAENGTIPDYYLAVLVNTALPSGDVYHQVQYGQSLWSIAIKYGTTINQIQTLNNLYDTNIYIGQKLLVVKNATQPVPPTSSYQTSTPTAANYFVNSTASVTPTESGTLTPQYSEEEKQQILISVGAIVFAALVLGGVFIGTAKKKE